MKKFNLKVGLFFGIWMSIIYIAQIFLFADNYTTTTILRAVFFGLIGGIIFGGFYGFFTGRSKSSKADDP